MYKTITGPKGTRYWRDGKLIKKADVPEEVIKQLETHASVDLKEKPKPKTCIFCGSFARYTRLVNMQTIALCEDDYYSKNIGKIAQRIKELDNE